MKKCKTSYQNKCNIAALSWNDKFKLPDEYYSVSDIEDYFAYVIKRKHWMMIHQ